MASLLLLGRGEDGSSSDFYLEYLCRSSFRLFREPLLHAAAPPLSPSTLHRVRAWIVRSARMAPPLQHFGAAEALEGERWLLKASDELLPGKADAGAAPAWNSRCVGVISARAATDGVQTGVARSSRTIAGGVVRARRSAANRPGRGATSHRSAANGGTPHASRTHSAPRPPRPVADANPTGSAAINSARAKLLGLQMIRARSFPSIHK
jgi:hypothetical protein